MLLLSLLFTACLETFPTGKENTFVDNPADDFDGDGQTEEEGDCNDDTTQVAICQYDRVDQGFNCLCRRSKWC